MSITHAIFIIAALGVLWSIYRLHLNPNVEFNALDLLMEGGRVSKVSCLVMGSFGVTSWLMLDLQVHGKMTEGYFMGYGGMWVAPLIVRLMNPIPSSMTTIETKTSEVVTTSKGKGK